MAEKHILLELKNIYKSYGPVKANRDVSLRLKKGEILGIIGENGAGKSTIMKILYGLETKDQGEIYLNGELVDIQRPSDAIQLGIGMLQQHFMLFDSMTVTENIVYNNEARKGLFLDQDKNKQNVLQISERYQLYVDPDEVIVNYPVGLQQRVEILKILYQNPEIIIFDEPSGILTPLEVQELLKNMLALKKLGKTIILITHKLHEVLQVTDSIVVMRAGEVVFETQTSKTDVDELAFQIVGRKLESEKVQTIQNGPLLLDVRSLTLRDSRGRTKLHDVNFQVNRGEIVGIAGVSGNGQSELIRCITGLLKANDGSITLDGNEISQLSVKEIRNSGLAHIPEDRFMWGSAARANLVENSIMSMEEKAGISKCGVFHSKQIKRHAEQLIQSYKVKADRPSQKISELSGGNIQKLIVAREMFHDSPLIIANEPTRGIDIGAMNYIHSELVKKRDKGDAVLLVSSELTEIMELSDRIYVIYEGSIVGEFSRDSLSAIALGRLMVGGTLHEN